MKEFEALIGVWHGEWKVSLEPPRKISQSAPAGPVWASETRICAPRLAAFSEKLGQLQARRSKLEGMIGAGGPGLCRRLAA